MSPTAATVTADDLAAFVRAICAAADVPTDDSYLIAAALVEADLRGVSSHGCARLPAYARALAARIINPKPELSRVRGGTAVELLDGDNGLGLVLGQRSMMRAVELAQGAGIGAVSVRNSNHTGMLAIHLTPATTAHMIGFFTSNAPAVMTPYGGRDPKLGNGPFAYGIPTRGEPIVVDMASSATNRGRIRLYANTGRRLPSGWALDDEGGATIDPAAALRGLLLPMAGHKGYGLAVVNEILAGVLAGATLAADMPREFLREGSRVLDSWRSGHLAIAIDLTAFAERETFLDQIDTFAAQLRSARPALGNDTVLLPGEPESARRAAQLESGIELGGAVIEGLDELASELGVEPLPHRR
ncbi:Ldh family oxidoreductase [Tenggerimyces flavus]|uniref:Ldh family oxidoreductase n=1 Tax=Tenggerimyces flavus TaxID=1708749 RepID=A0ABV7YJN6_9ACTN|nr:Ldh family oxidoreductase [Tenggerimyces flavus]MBM7789631.1 LDH2 family malate/lactate/ureidoglycolate dehydrogenase [Tenggerimyces flavus]